MPSTSNAKGASLPLPLRFELEELTQIFVSRSLDAVLLENPDKDVARMRAIARPVGDDKWSSRWTYSNPAAGIWRSASNRVDIKAPIANR